MTSEDERIAMMNIVLVERLIVLSYWASQYGIIQHAEPRVEGTYPLAPPLTPVHSPWPEQSPPPDDEVYLMCDEEFDLIELDLDAPLELTPDEFTLLVNSLF